jgi:hypothetical protein
VELVLEALPLGRVGAVVLGGPDLILLAAHLAHHFLDPGAEPRGLRLDVLVGQIPEPRLVRVDLLDQGAELLHFALVTIADDRAHQLLQHPAFSPSRATPVVARAVYSCPAAM